MMTEDNQNQNETNPILLTEEAAPSLENITLGRLIKAKREEKGLSLKVISQQTKIHIGLLESLEADQYEKLPSKAYVRGFVKSTGKILNLDQELALHLLDMAYSKITPVEHSISTAKEMRAETARNTLSTITATPLETVKSVTASSGLFLAKSAAVVLIVGIVGFNVKNFMEKTDEEAEMKLPEVLTTLHKKKPAVKKVEPKTTPAELKPEVPIQVNLIQDKNVKSDVTVNDINLKTISIGERQFAEDNSMSEETIKETLPAKYRIQPTKGVETVFINATEGDSWLTYKVDDKEIKKFVLRQGRTLFLRGSLIRLFIGNTYSLKVFYNNKPINLNIVNKSGVKNLVIPEDMKTKYMAPLFVFQEDGTVMTSDEYLKVNQGGKPAKAPATSPTTNSAAPTPTTPTSGAAPVKNP